MEQNRIALWIAQIRAPFLILPVLLVAIGVAFAHHYSGQNENFNWIHAGLLFIGVISSHISVNLFNEFSDFKTKIDLNTQRTPFSGGSGIVSSGLLSVKAVKYAAVISLLVAMGIGIFFALHSHWVIWIFALIGGLTIIFYTPVLAKLLLGELFSGLTLGTMVVLGSYLAMVAQPDMALTSLFPKDVILLSIPPGILTSLLLLINELPDLEADQKGGRFHLVIWLGRKGGAYIYAAGMILTFGWVLFWALTGAISLWFLIALLPVPLAVKASLTAILHGNNNKKLVPALGMNVMTVLGTDLLIAIAVLAM